MAQHDQPQTDGEWWTGLRKISHRCTGCDGESQEPPAVMYYKPELDHDNEQANLHPRWPEKGWLAWWQCSACDHNGYEVVDVATIASWQQTQWTDA